MVAMLAKPILLGISTAHNSGVDVRGGHVGQADPIGDIHGMGTLVRATLANLLPEADLAGDAHSSCANQQIT